MYPFNLYENWRIRSAQREFFSRVAYGISRTSKFSNSSLYWAEEQKISSVDFEHILWVCLRRVAKKYGISLSNLEMMLGDIKYEVERLTQITVSEW